MNYKKLFEFANATVERCNEIEKVRCRRIKENPEHKEFMDSLTPDERQAAVDFICKVNTLRWTIKEKHLEFVESN